MKHCAKKLLGLAFALALCLAVGGTALAETPESANVPAALPEQEMLAYEPNVTTAAGNNVTGNIVTDGYQVTIPTTVEVKSGENKDKLKVTAEMKQWRTLEIDIASYNKWKLKYQGDAAGTTTPEVGYTLENTECGGHTSQGMIWTYDAANHKIAYTTTRLTAVDKAEIPLSVNVTDPSQATMSGTYSDTLAFDFKITKQSVTYTINVYHQEMALTNNYFNRADNAPNYQALKMVDKVGTNGAPIDGAQPDEVYTYEYGFAYDKPVGSPPETWTRPRTGHNVPEDEDTRCWEDLTYDLNLQQNYNDDKKDIVVNLNLVRKWCWLDVNGITNKDENGVPADGNQGGKIASFVNIKVYDGKNWSVWYWYTTGDDYWGTFPYGTEFQLGLHRVKDGYAYDEDASGNVAIYANDELKQTTSPPKKENGTTYRVYQGTLTGEPVDETLHPTSGGGNVHEGAGGKALPRYCYNVCFVDGITYYANDGTGGREDTNLHHGPHTTFKYTDSVTLADPLNDELTGCKFTAPAGKVFAGWSTTKDYTGQTLYAPGDSVSSVEWLAKTGTSNNDTLPTNDGQTVCRTLYAIWDDKKVTTNPGSTTPQPGPNRAPAKKALTLCYHANFDPMEELALDLDPDPLLEDMDDTFGFDPDPLPEDVDDALEEAVKTVRYQPGEDVVLRNCMFKRGGYVFVGWNTEPDGTGKKYEVNGVPITDWAAGDTVDLYAQWKKPEHLKPVVDSEPFVPADPDTPPERIDDGFDADFGADPDPQPGGMDDAFGADPDPLPEGMDDAFGIDPDPLPEALDDAFGV